jgi:hypothetical protein
MSSHRNMGLSAATETVKRAAHLATCEKVLSERARRGREPACGRVVIVVARVITVILLTRLLLLLELLRSLGLLGLLELLGLLGLVY